MSEEPKENGASSEQEPEEGGKKPTRFSELAELQQEIERRIRDNKRFLERFLDEDFVDEEEEAEEDEGGDFEEL